MATKRKTTSLPVIKDGQTAQEVADGLRKKAQGYENYRNRPEVRRAIARNPQLLETLLEMERLAAEMVKVADEFEAQYGHMTAAEFAALNAYTDEWVRRNPEEAAGLMRDAKKYLDAGKRGGDT